MAEAQETKATSCPNCQQPAIRSGNEITCENCDAIFVITKKSGAKLKQIGAIEDLQERVEKLESRTPGDEPTPVESPEGTPAGSEIETEEEPIL